MDGKEDGYMNEQTVMSCADCGWHVKQLKFWDEHHHFPYVTWWCSHPNVLRNFNANAPVDRGYCPPRTKPDKIYYNLLKEIPINNTLNCTWCPLTHKNEPIVDWV